MQLEELKTNCKLNF